MEAAYNALSDERKAFLEGKQMVHSFTALRRYENTIPPMAEEDVPPPAVHPVVCTVDGRKVLFLSNQTCYYVGNMPFEEGCALYEELIAHATSPQFVYEHVWSPGDLAMWDDRTTMHRAVPYDSSKRRIMHRAEVKGTQVPS
jgi:taurine dioxygenase